MSDRSGRRRLTSDAHRNRTPAWSPDGKEIVFFSDRQWGNMIPGSSSRTVVVFAPSQQVLTLPCRGRSGLRTERVSSRVVVRHARPERRSRVPGRPREYRARFTGTHGRLEVAVVWRL